MDLNPLSYARLQTQQQPSPFLTPLPQSKTSIQINPNLRGLDNLKNILVDLGIISDDGTLNANFNRKEIFSSTDGSSYKFLQTTSRHNETILSLILEFYSGISHLLEKEPQLVGGSIPFIFGPAFYSDLLRKIPGLEGLTDSEIKSLIGDQLATISMPLNDIDVQWVVKRGKLEEAMTILNSFVSHYYPGTSTFYYPEIGIGGVSFSSFFPQGAPLEFILLDRQQVRPGGKKIRNYLFSKDSLKLRIHYKPPTHRGILRAEVIPYCEKFNKEDSMTALQAVFDQMFMTLRSTDYDSLDLRAAGQFLILQTKGWRTFDQALTAHFAKILSDPSYGLGSREDNLVWLLQWGMREHLKSDLNQKLFFVFNTIDFLLCNTDFTEIELRSVWNKLRYSLNTPSNSPLLTLLVEMLDSHDTPVRMTFSWLKACALNVTESNSADLLDGNYLTSNRGKSSLCIKRHCNGRNGFLWLDLNGETPLVAAMNFITAHNMPESCKTRFLALEKMFVSPQGMAFAPEKDRKELQRAAWKWIDSSDFFVVKKGVDLILDLIDSRKYQGDIGVDFLKKIPNLYSKWQHQLPPESFLAFCQSLEKIWNDINHKNKGIIRLPKPAKIDSEPSFTIEWIIQLLHMKGNEYRLGFAMIMDLSQQQRQMYAPRFLHAISNEQRKENLFQQLINDLPFDQLYKDLKNNGITKNGKIAGPTLLRYPLLKGVDAPQLKRWIPLIKKGNGSIEKQLFDLRVQWQKKTKVSLADLIQLANEGKVTNHEVWEGVAQRVFSSEGSKADQLALYNSLLAREDMGKSLFGSPEIWQRVWIDLINHDVYVAPDLIALSEDQLDIVFPVDETCYPLLPLSWQGRLAFTRHVIRPDSQWNDAWADNARQISCYLNFVSDKDQDKTCYEDLIRSEKEFIQAIVNLTPPNFESLTIMIKSVIDLLGVIKAGSICRNPGKSEAELEFLQNVASVDLSGAKRIDMLLVLAGAIIKNRYADVTPEMHALTIEILVKIHIRINTLLSDRSIYPHGLPEALCHWFDELSRFPNLYKSELLCQDLAKKLGPEIFIKQHIQSFSAYVESMPGVVIQNAFCAWVKLCMLKKDSDVLHTALVLFDSPAYRGNLYNLKMKDYIPKTIEMLYKGYTYLYAYGTTEQRQAIPRLDLSVKNFDYDASQHELHKVLYFDEVTGLNDPYSLEIGVTDCFIPIQVFISRADGANDVLQHYVYYYLLQLLKLDRIAISAAQFLNNLSPLEELERRRNYPRILASSILDFAVNERGLFTNPDDPLTKKARAICFSVKIDCFDGVDQVFEDLMALDTIQGYNAALKLLTERYVINPHINLYMDLAAQQKLEEMINRILNVLNRLPASEQTGRSYDLISDLLSTVCINARSNYYSPIFERLIRSCAESLKLKMAHCAAKKNVRLGNLFLGFYLDLVRNAYFKRLICHGAMTAQFRDYDQSMWLDIYVRPVIDNYLIPIALKDISSAIESTHALVEMTQDGIAVHYYWNELRQPLVESIYIHLQMNSANHSEMSRALLNWLNNTRKNWPDVYCAVALFPKQMEVRQS